LDYGRVEITRDGVEESLNAEQRREVRQRFANSPVQLFGIGSIYEFHSLDQEVVRQNIEGAKRSLQLAHDLGAGGVKVRPNGHQEKAGVPRQQTLQQIGQAARECGQTARDLGIELRMEMHGAVRQAATMRRIFEAADGYCWACWNSNDDDVQDGSIKQAFDQVQSLDPGSAHHPHLESKLSVSGTVLAAEEHQLSRASAWPKSPPAPTRRS